MSSYVRMILRVESLSTPRPRQLALTEVMLGIVAERGLDQVTVREVATAAEVSIGTVQYYFPTKDAMLAAAFTEVVRRIRARVRAIEPGPDVRASLSEVLRELLPLDPRRAEEVRVQVAFTARAATSPALAEIQRRVLDEIHRELTAVFVLLESATPMINARLTLAATDGLALHAVSSDGGLSSAEQCEGLEHLLDVLLPAPR